jgi:hypothetical protein
MKKKRNKTRIEKQKNEKIRRKETRKENKKN